MLFSLPFQCCHLKAEYCTWTKWKIHQQIVKYPEFLLNLIRLENILNVIIWSVANVINILHVLFTAVEGYLTMVTNGFYVYMSNDKMSNDKMSNDTMSNDSRQYSD